MFRYIEMALALSLAFVCASSTAQQWAYLESFNEDPASPSQTVLPPMDYVVTHRTHPKDHLSAETSSFPADHGPTCSAPPDQHPVVSSHLSNGANPDQSFYVCKNHMMSSLGDVSGYSVSTFYPRQSFRFTPNGVLEFETNMDIGHPRFWWEVMIVPREYLKVGAAEHWLPIDETYAAESIVFSLQNGGKRKIQYHHGGIPPSGIVFSQSDWRDWVYINNDVPNDDPQFQDRRRRHLHRIEFFPDEIVWSVEKLDGTMDTFSVILTEPLAFEQGLVLFKTHSYTPTKDGNFDRYTVHWDEIRFSGPVVGRFAAIESADLVYLQANGSRPIGDSVVQTIDIPDAQILQANPVLFGQIHNPVIGQVLLRINGGPDIEIAPYEYEDGCNSSGWKSFRLPLSAADMQVGSNLLTWTIGPRPDCLQSWEWDGFSIKGLELQHDLLNDISIQTVKSVPIHFYALLFGIFITVVTGLRALRR